MPTMYDNGFIMNANAQHWLNRVAVKLNKLQFSGIDFNIHEYEWVFDWNEKASEEDNLKNVAAEDNALTVFDRMKVIESDHRDNFYRNQHYEGLFDPAGSHDVWADWKDFHPAKQTYDYVRMIYDLDYDKFLAFCAEHELTLKETVTPATLTITDQKPVIEVANTQYILKSLQDGTTLEIIEAATAYPNEKLSVAKLRLAIGKPNALTSQNNLKQIFRKNEFGKGNILHPFAEITSTSFMLKTRASLTPSELSAIQKVSTN